MENNLKTIQEILEIISDHKAQDKKIVFTNGCFDILHKGHITLLDQAKKFGDILIIGLNSDNSVKRLKGEGRPKNSELDRAMIIGNLKDVDYVVVFEEDTPCEIISKLKPHIHVKGGDYDPSDFSNMPEAEVVQNYGGEVKIVPIVEGYSTTSILNDSENEI